MNFTPTGVINPASNCHINSLFQILISFAQFRENVARVDKPLERLITSYFETQDHVMPLRILNYLMHNIENCSIAGGQDAISVDLFYMLDALDKSVSRLFLFEVEKIYVCSACKHSYGKADEIYLMNPHLTNFSHPVDYVCDKCGRKDTTYNKAIKILQYPYILICSGNNPGQIPADRYRQMGNREYMLEATIEYPGRAHYSATCSAGGKSYKCDDNVIIEIPTISISSDTLFAFYRIIRTLKP